MRFYRLDSGVSSLELAIFYRVLRGAIGSGSRWLTPRCRPAAHNIAAPYDRLDVITLFTRTALNEERRNERYNDFIKAQH